jgi:hypothetical protein
MSQPYGSPRPVTGIALPFTFFTFTVTYIDKTSLSRGPLKDGICEIPNRPGEDNKQGVRILKETVAYFMVLYQIKTKELNKRKDHNKIKNENITASKSRYIRFTLCNVTTQVGAFPEMDTTSLEHGQHKLDTARMPMDL